LPRPMNAAIAIAAIYSAASTVCVAGNQPGLSIVVIAPNLEQNPAIAPSPGSLSVGHNARGRFHAAIAS
jgi:hypothetical protein